MSKMSNAPKKKKIGLFFGSFNPIHIGHLIIANYMVTQTDLEKVWLIVSPQNPLKPKSTLARDYDRLHLVRLAIEDNPKLEASNIEFDLPKPLNFILLPVSNGMDSIVWRKT